MRANIELNLKCDMSKNILCWRDTSWKWAVKTGRRKRSIPREEGGVWGGMRGTDQRGPKRSIHSSLGHNTEIGLGCRLGRFCRQNLFKKSGMRKRTQHIRTQCTRFSYKIKSFNAETCPDLNGERTQKPTTTNSSLKSRHYINTPVWPNNWQKKPEKPHCPFSCPPGQQLLSTFTSGGKKPWTRVLKKGSVEEEEREKAERSNAVRCGWGGVSTLPRLQGKWNLWPSKGKGGVFFFFFFWRFAVLEFFGSQQAPWLQFWFFSTVPKCARFPLSLNAMNKT